MDCTRKLIISDECNCHIDICFKNLIEFGLRPAIEKTAIVIAASLSNTKLLGLYLVDLMFVIGNVFALPSDSAMQKSITAMLQDAIMRGIESKGKDTKGIVLKESFFQTLQTESWQNPFMCDSFCDGNLSQVSRYTYGIRIESLRVAGLDHPFLYWKNYDGKEKDIVACEDDVFVILQKGQPIPTAGLVIKLDLCSGGEDPYYPDVESKILNMSNTINLGKKKCYIHMKLLNNNVLLEVLKIADTKNDGVALEGVVPIYPNTYDKMSTLRIFPTKYVAGRHIILEIKNINHNFSVRFSAKMTGDSIDHEKENQCLTLEQPLTLAYI